jgi:elongation factor P
MYTASDLRKGLKIEVDGAPYVITDFQFVKPGKGQALYRCKMKNLINGSTLDKTYRAVEKIDKPNLEQRDLIYSYQDGEHFVFMDSSTYEQVLIDAEVLGDQRYFLVEDMEVEILFHNDMPIEVSLPFFIEKTIVETEPGARGDTATNVMKPANWITGMRSKCRSSSIKATGSGSTRAPANTRTGSPKDSRGFTIFHCRFTI